MIKKKKDGYIKQYKEELKEKILGIFNKKVE